MSDILSVVAPEDIDPLEVARGILQRMTPEERLEVQVTAEKHGISEEYVILEAVLQLDQQEHDLGELGN